MFNLFKKKEVALNRGLYDSKFILKNYKTEDSLRGLSKKQIEKVIDTLEKELNFQTNYLSVYLMFTALIFAIIFFIVPNTNNEIGSGIFTNINGKDYQLESINLEYKDFNYPEKDNINGTFKYFGGFEKSLLIIYGSCALLAGIYLVFFTNIYHWRKLRKLYNNARYIYSLK